MSQEDWKTYYSIIVEDNEGYIRLYPYLNKLVVYKDHERAIAAVRRIRKYSWFVKPIGLARLRGNKANPQVQKWLLEHSK